MSRLAKRTWDDTGAMSIHDRDWLREAPLRPPSNDSTFTTWLIVAATAVVWAMRHFNLSLPHSDPKVAFEPTSPATRKQVQELETPPRLHRPSTAAPPVAASYTATT